MGPGFKSRHGFNSLTASPISALTYFKGYFQRHNVKKNQLQLQRRRVQQNIGIVITKRQLAHDFVFILPIYIFNMSRPTAYVVVVVVVRHKVRQSYISRTV